MAQALQKRDSTGHKQKTFQNESFKCKDESGKKCKSEKERYITKFQASKAVKNIIGLRIFEQGRVIYFSFIT